MTASADYANWTSRYAAISTSLSDAELHLIAGKEETYCALEDCEGPWIDGDCSKCAETQPGGGVDPQCPVWVKKYGAIEMCFDCVGEGCVPVHNFPVWRKFNCKANGDVEFDMCCQTNNQCQYVVGCLGVDCRKCTQDGNDPVDSHSDTVWYCVSQ
jgi:hypothetical protein